jgi:hypothetical protein
MASRGLLITGVVLLIAGIVGILALWFFPAGVGYVSTGNASLGQQIYYTGTDASGPIERTIAGAPMMGTVGMADWSCVDCHGQDGRGGNVPTPVYGVVTVPNIRYSTLTHPHSEAGTTVPAWTDADIARAVRTGVLPGNDTLDPPMPHWNMNDADMAALIAYLKELDTR